VLVDVSGLAHELMEAAIDGGALTALVDVDPACTSTTVEDPALRATSDMCAPFDPTEAVARAARANRMASFLTSLR
jgi:hypothetical protein